MPTFPFEVTFRELQANLDEFAAVVVGSLESEFLVLPKGTGFVEYSVFESGYEALKRATSSFRTVTREVVLPATLETPIALIVLRAMLGFTPPEWAYVATLETGVDVPQGAARALDRGIRVNPLKPLSAKEATQARITALVETACRLLNKGAPKVLPGKMHRLDKADTKTGLASIQSLAKLGAPSASGGKT